MRSPILASGLALVSLLPACTEAPGVTEQHEEEQGRILVTVTVDWEGRDLTEANLSAMERLRERFPELVLVHYLNAAYFTKPGVDEALTREKIARTLREGDELGLHVHGWKSLFEASGVSFRNSPTFWDPNGVVTECSFDCGHEVPISAYTEEELGHVFAFSIDKLEEQGFGRARSFRAGGWMAEPHVHDALVSQDIVSDGSAVPVTFLQGEIGQLPLYGWLTSLWLGTTSQSQPHTVDTQHGPLLEIPDNGALADYVTGSEMIAVFDQATKQLEAAPTEDVVVSIGFHQETAAKYLPRVELALDEMLRRSKEEGVPTRFVTAEELVAKTE